MLRNKNWTRSPAKQAGFRFWALAAWGFQICKKKKKFVHVRYSIGSGISAREERRKRKEIVLGGNGRGRDNGTMPDPCVHALGPTKVGCMINIRIKT